MCGEKIRVASPRITQRGSPPRVRGKVAERCYTDCACGITPACAGKRTRRLQMRQDERDHPRVCGEKQLVLSAEVQKLGSPPRVRGKVNSMMMNKQGLRITPACAGKSSWARTPKTTHWDHPRVCGEKLTDYQLFYQKGGSPPRVRGKGACNQAVCPDNGITPACAGKSSFASFITHTLWDHPRVCGEKAAAAAPAHNQSGSPPRVRGKVPIRPFRSWQ